MEEQAWLDVVPMGREFGSPNYERLQILDLYAVGRRTSDDAMRQLGADNLEILSQQMLAAGLASCLFRTNRTTYSTWIGLDVHERPEYAAG